MRIFLLWFLVWTCFQLPAQSRNENGRMPNVAEQLSALKAGATAATVDPFLVVNRQDLNHAHLDYISGQAYMEIDERKLQVLREERPLLLEMGIPLPGGAIKQLSLFRTELFSFQPYRILTSDGRVIDRNPNLLFYRGIVSGDRESLAVVSILNREIRVLVSDAAGNYRIQLTDEDVHIGYMDEDLRLSEEYSCDVSPELEIMDEGTGGSQRSMSGNCVEIFFETDFESYQDNNSSVSETEDWVTALFNEVSTLYANEMIPVSISDIFIWTTTDPYAEFNSTSEMLTAFKNYRNENGYIGRLAHLLSTRSVGGGIAYVNVLCSTNNQYGVSGSLSTNIVPVPNYSWNVEVVTHELGHNFGSRHTHRCVWNGDNTQIDDCGNVYVNNQGNTPEGDACFDENNPILPDDGTIMSYCHLISGIGIDFNLGFGPQPGAYILDKYENASCNTGTCGPPPCTELTVPINGETGVPLNIQMEWSPAGAATGYVLTVGTTPGGIDILDSLDVGDVTSYAFDSLPANTTIYVSIFPYNLLGEATGCNEESFTTGTGYMYCSSQGNNIDDEWIDLFGLGSFSNTSGASHYSDYTDMIIDVSGGVTYPAEMSMGYAGQSYPEYFRVWIDFNQDGDFDDSGEQVFSQGPATSAVTGNISIPEDALPGTTRLRVSMKYNSYPGPCEAFTFGEVEDYTIRVNCNTVYSTGISGPGSLRAVLDCVSDGDTVLFANSINNQSINIGPQPVLIDKDLVILAEVDQNIAVNALNATRCFEIALGQNVNLEGLTINSGYGSQGAAILNDGTLVVKDVHLIANPQSNGGSLLQNSGILTVAGSCSLEE